MSQRMERLLLIAPRPSLTEATALTQKALTRDFPATIFTLEPDAERDPGVLVLSWANGPTPIRIALRLLRLTPSWVRVEVQQTHMATDELAHP